ncbi:pyruvate-flavodoxin oxidoreductase, partial [Candidatus Endoriftia persephone str. Guaymas]|nr:pyruvate-flavodoxin oxidoreductase [Candidatus Endoriftia persephone str. Guaymas]
MEQYTLIAILGGLLVLALFLSGIVQRHQQAVEAKRIKIQRLLRGVDLVEN